MKNNEISGPLTYEPFWYEKYILTPGIKEIPTSIILISVLTPTKMRQIRELNVIVEITIKQKVIPLISGKAIIDIE